MQPSEYGGSQEMFSPPALPTQAPTGDRQAVRDAAAASDA
jgi:hypothetical protein